MTRIDRPPAQARARLRRALVAWVVAGLVAVPLGLTAAQRLGSVDPWWIELSRYLPYPALLLPPLLALTLSWRLGRRWVLASLGAGVMVATVTMGLRWRIGDLDQRAVQGARHVRLMTYNVKAFKALRIHADLAGLAREVALHDPDILVMQDANREVGVLSPSAFAATAVFGLPNVYIDGQYVVASRLPLRGCAPQRLGRRADGLSVVRCVVDVGGVDLSLVTVHFESPRSGLNAARREGVDGIDEWRRNYRDRDAQAQALAAELTGVARPLVVAGDLNAPDSSPVIRTLLATGLRDAFSVAGRGYGYSYGQALRLGFSFLRIDHILASPEIGIADCFAGNGEASDHQPVIADLWLPGAR